MDEFSSKTTCVMECENGIPENFLDEFSMICQYALSVILGVEIAITFFSERFFYFQKLEMNQLIKLILDI